MIKGIFIFEHGGIQQIGDLNSLAGIITTIKQILPELERQESERVLQQLSDADLQNIIEARKNKKSDTDKTERKT